MPLFLNFGDGVKVSGFFVFFSTDKELAMDVEEEVLPSMECALGFVSLVEEKFVLLETCWPSFLITTKEGVESMPFAFVPVFVSSISSFLLVDEIVLPPLLVL